MTDRKLLGFYPAMQPVQEVAAGDRGAVPAILVSGSLALGNILDVGYSDTAPLHNFAPSGYETAGPWRILFAEPVVVTGMVKAYDGEIRTILNDSAETVIFANGTSPISVGSDEQNRFLYPVGGDFQLFSSGVAMFFYDPNSSFGGPMWRLLSYVGGVIE